MKKILLPVLLFTVLNAPAQNAPAKLSFPKGKKLELVMQSKSIATQELMGMPMELNISSTVTHLFDVEDVKGNVATLEHKIKRIQTSMEGMGQKQSFDSENENDRNSEMGKHMEKSLKNKYTMDVDASGRIVSVKADDDNPNKEKEEDADNPLSMMVQGVNLPKAGDPSIFKILPAKPLTKGLTWTDSLEIGGMGTTIANYTVTDITPGEILIDFTADGVMQRTQEAMGMEATINMKNKSTGRITLDKKSGLLKQRTTNLEGQGTVEAAGQSIPMTNKMTITETVTGF